MDANEDIVSSLGDRLSDAIALSLHAKQAHWNVAGPSFQGLHELFDKVHAMAVAHYDLIAERIVQLGGSARIDGTTGLPRYAVGGRDGRDHAEAVAASLGAYSEGLRATAALADDAGDVATLDLLSEALRDADKHEWFVKSHLVGGRAFNGRGLRRPPGGARSRGR